MSQSNKVLQSLLFFNSVTALIGGAALILGLINPPVEWLPGVFFHSYLLPGLILLFAAGGSAALGRYSILKMLPHAYEIAGLSGIVMMVWIAGEIVAIRQLNWLQALYMLTGSVVAVIAGRMVSIKSTGRA